MKRMLDGLMGTDRDNVPERRTIRKDFMDHDVCKSYLLGLCPFDLFHHTKYKAGICNKVHEMAHKINYEQASAVEGGFGYEVSFYLFI